MQGVHTLLQQFLDFPDILLKTNFLDYLKMVVPVVGDISYQLRYINTIPITNQSSGPISMSKVKIVSHRIG